MERLAFSCPQCGSVNEAGINKAECGACGYSYLLNGAIYNFIRPDTDRGSEQDFYNSVYEAVPQAGKRRSIEACVELWNARHQPEFPKLREAVGPLAGKDVLLIGNGASEKELAFLLDRPRVLVYSDLSPHASRHIQSSYDLSPHRDRLLFAAMDAQNIPFCDHSFDLVYGFAMVHHLPDIPRFIRGVCRVLRPGGKAVFFDDAYSPIWHFSKQTVLRPLMRYSHKKTGISPEDYRFSMSGGFKEGELARVIRTEGAEPWFERASFLTYLTFRAAEKLLPQRTSERLKSSGAATAISALDGFLGKFSVVRSNQIRLIWGLVTP